MSKMRKTRKGHVSSRKSRGGATPNTIHYTYTKDSKRGRWIDTIYPYGGVIVSLLPKIRWETFRYEGPLLIETDSDDQGSVRLYDTMGHSLPVSGAPYEVFGGAACELWGRKIPNIPIHKFVDITGDIDVSVSQPTVVPEKAILRRLIDKHGPECLRPLMIYKDTYTPYGEAFSGWLFSEVVTQIQSLAGELDIPGLDLPGRDENSETALGDLHAMAGNLLCSRLITQDRSMIKIQISTKVLPDTVDHIMEFILSPQGDFRSTTRFTTNGIYVQGPIQLLVDQVEGLADRADGVKSRRGNHEMARIENNPSFYKFDNHCARLLYLATLIKSVEGKHYPENDNTFMYMTVRIATYILESLYMGGRGAMCDAHFGPKYIDKLTSIFESMQHVGQLRTESLK